MKKVKFRKPNGKALYALLCVGILAVGIASVAGYRAAVSSVTDGLINDQSQTDIPDIDFSAVDAVVSDIEKDKPAEQNVPQEALPAAPFENVPESEAIVDVTDELEALYYERAIMMPINGEILAAYSGGELVRTSGGVWRTHDGIDIAAEQGAKVKAMTSGTVAQIYDDPLWGCCVVVDHGNTLSGCYYGLAPELSVSVGQLLNAGDEIGTVGSTNDLESDIDSHLHFALRYQGEWIDPIQYIEPMK